MKKEEIKKIASIRNIEEAGFKVEGTVPGKGLKVVNSNETFMRVMPKYCSKQQLLEYLERKAGYYKMPLSELTVTSLSIGSDHYLADINQTMTVEEFKKFDKPFDGRVSLTVERKQPYVVGYIPTSKIEDASFDSMVSLVENLLDMGNQSIYTSEAGGYINFDYNDEVVEFDGGSNVDYFEVHGDSFYSMETYSCNYFEGRMNNPNPMVLDNFYEFDFDELDFGHVDLEDIVDVYTRKGKDWYIGNRLTLADNFIYFYEDDPRDFYSEEDLDEEYHEALVYEDFEPALEAVEENLANIKHSLEVNGFIYDELDAIDDETLYSKGTFKGKYLEEEILADGYEFAMTIADIAFSFSNHGEAEDVVEKALEKYLLESFDIKGRLFGKYTHLLKLQELAEADGKEMTYSRIGDFTDDCLYAIKFKDEEYHFFLRELFVTSPKRFYHSVSAKLSDRLRERYAQSILMKNASRVFVGLEDSYESGNCKAGTGSWTARFGIDTKKIGGLRGDEVLKLDFSSFTKRAVMQAIKREKIA